MNINTTINVIMIITMMMIMIIIVIIIAVGNGLCCTHSAEIIAIKQGAVGISSSLLSFQWFPNGHL